MIADALLAFLASLASVLFAPLPALTLPSQVTTGVASVMAPLGIVNTWVPLLAIGAAVAAWFVFLVVLRGVTLAIWVYHQFWGSD